MEELMEAIKANDLVAVRKAVAPLLQERTSSLIEELKVEIASSVMIEGEEPEEDEEDDADEKKEKKNDDDADEGDDDDDEDDE
ncbi:putative prohead core protein [Klebsiella phage vB_KpnM_Potts1]|uniref:Putative prohead core protein n=1 Tax=Klebsiella phage vB_KpnM_Potts1 TaxID=2591366 RepID=A0A5B9NF70_9CAUD|nr:putative prohead core protein [Klebsiella phage vB_KpnM_Potts1]